MTILLIHQPSREIRGKSSCNITDDGQSIQFFCVQGPTTIRCDIEIGSFRRAALGALNRLKELIAEFYLLAGADQPQLGLASIHDNVSLRESIFEQCGPLFNPLVLPRPRTATQEATAAPQARAAHLGGPCNPLYVPFIGLQFGHHRPFFSSS